jgi:hypothetical protein
MPVTFYGNPRFDAKEAAMHLEAAMHVQGEVKAIAELEDRFAVAYQARKPHFALLLG